MANIKKSVFWVVTICLPFALLLALEFSLRWAGFGKTIPLFMENPQAPHYLLPTPKVVQRYFADESLAPNVTIEPNFFLKEKPKDGLRIIVQGGSTAAGFPYGLGASIAGMLDYRLKQTFPDRPVEVINTALSAVNSYTLLDFADEIIEQQPDAVLIYAGHNEFLGILGAGSAYTAANSHGATLMYLKLKDLRIFQLMQKMYAAMVTPDISKASETSRTVMAKVAKHKNIPVDSELFQAGVSQFEQNMGLLLAKYQKAGIPVFISTIASNLKDQKPFSSKPVPDTLQPLMAKPIENLSPSDTQTLQEQAAGNADINFRLGQAFYQRGDYQQARSYFEAARQHDLLRFRAPNETNQIIKKLAKQPGVTLVDAEADLVSASEHGIIGARLMIEHLHPTVAGYFEIADSFYQALHASDTFGPFAEPISTFAAKRELPLFAAEEYWGKAKIAGLLADYPFSPTPQPVKYPVRRTWQDELGMAAYLKKVDWIQLATETQKRAVAEGKQLEIIKSVKLLADAIPNDVSLNMQAGSTLIRANRPAEALRYLKRVILEQPEHLNAHLALGHAYANIQRLRQALVYLEKAQGIAPNNKVAKQNIVAIKQHLAANGG